MLAGRVARLNWPSIRRVAWARPPVEIAWGTECEPYEQAGSRSREAGLIGEPMKGAVGLHVAMAATQSADQFAIRAM